MTVIVPKKVSPLDKYKTLNQVLHLSNEDFRMTMEKIKQDVKEAKKSDPAEHLATISRRATNAIERHKQRWKSINFDDYTVDKTLQPLTKFPDNGEQVTGIKKTEKTLEEF